MKWKRTCTPLVAAGLLLPVLSPVASAQDTTEEMQQEFREMMDEMTEEMENMTDLTESLKPGTTNFLVTGYAFSGFTNAEGGNSSFDSRVFPIFLWKLSDQVFASSEIEFELGATATKINLEFLELNYIVNDWLTLKAGKFLTPLSTFKEQIHPAWINKLPDQPLYATGGARLIPTSSLGFVAQGAIPVNNDMKFTYAAWLSNGPSLVTTGGKAGQLNFSNFSDVNNNKAVGARLGFFPMPELEVAYAFTFADVGASGTAFNKLDATIHDISATYVLENESLGGRLDLRGEYVLSDVDDVDYGSGIFNNEREGGYFQLAYRPTMSGGFFKDMEFVVRYDFLNNPTAALDGKAYDEERWTIGVNYWLNPSSVVKVGYRFDDIEDPTNALNTGSDAFLAQFAIGF